MTIWTVIEGLAGGGHKSTATSFAKTIGKLAVSIGVERGNLQAVGMLNVKRMHRASGPAINDHLSAMAPDDPRKLPPSNFWEWDEIGGILGSDPNKGRVDPVKDDLRNTLLSLHAGETGDAGTLSSSATAKPCSVAILGSMTRDDLKEKMDLGFVNSGLFPRFLFVPSLPEQKLARPPVASEDFEAAQVELATWLSHLLARPDDDRIGNAYHRMTTEAATWWDDWFTRRNSELSERAETTKADVDKAVLKVFDRGNVTAIKVAGLLALAEFDVTDTSRRLDRVRIDVQHLQHAVALLEFCMNETRYLIDGEPEDPMSKYQKQVIAWLEREYRAGTQSEFLVGDYFKLRDVLRNNKYKMLNAEEKKDALSALHPDVLVITNAERNSVQVRFSRDELADRDLSPSCHPARVTGKT